MSLKRDEYFAIQNSDDNFRLLPVVDAQYVGARMFETWRKAEDYCRGIKAFTPVKVKIIRVDWVLNGRGRYEETS